MIDLPYMRIVLIETISKALCADESGRDYTLSDEKAYRRYINSYVFSTLVNEATNEAMSRLFPRVEPAVMSYRSECDKLTGLPSREAHAATFGLRWSQSGTRKLDIISPDENKRPPEA